MVSMNFWGFSTNIFKTASKQFSSFLKYLPKDSSSEFYISTIVDDTIKSNLMHYKMLPTTSQWYGITYKEDVEEVSTKISGLINQNIYPEQLW